MNIIHNQGRMVYHYTSLDVFNKMMDNLDDGNIIFHANGIHCMNDSSEFLYGFKEFRRILPAIENRIGIIDDSLKLSRTIDLEDKMLHGDWNEEFADILFEGLRMPFVISTSAHNDSVPMWAMYGNGGSGVAMGLDISNCFVKIKGTDGIDIYDTTKYDDIANCRALKIVQTLSINHPAAIDSRLLYKNYLRKAQQAHSKEELLSLKIKAVYGMSVITSALVKHPAFKFENEWRIISMARNNDDIHYQINGKGHITPYLKVRIPIGKFRKLVVGPCCGNRYQKEIIERLLEQKGIQNCKVVRSKVPYR